MFVALGMGMTSCARSLRHLATTLVALATLAGPVVAQANELGSSLHANGFVIHDANETLQSYCHWQGGLLVFTLPGGTSWELVTSTSDPAIANPGDGQFHPYDAAEVRSALAGVRFPLQRVGAEIFILPYPRRLGLESGAGPGLVLLSPGVRPLSAELQHSEFTHELGHVVQYALMPDADTLHWSEYRSRRGITDAATYSAAAAHADRPHEIFAEDFRVLFGDAQANYAGTIENGSLTYPTQVRGLDKFMASLSNAPAHASTLAVVSTTAGQAVFARPGSGASPLDVYDVLGRHIVSVVPTVDGSGCRWTWDGRDAAGVQVRAMMLFARARDGLGGVAKLTRLP